MRRREARLVAWPCDPERAKTWWLAGSFNDAAAWRQLTELEPLSYAAIRLRRSHELRTPLTTIKLAGDVLFQERSFDSKTRRNTELLNAQVLRLRSFRDLLEISRYDAGSVNLNPSHNVAGLFRMWDHVPVAGSMVAICRSRPWWSMIDIDPRRVRRILMNLIGNAI
jgi:two-component system sensor histidine kinase MtrB